MVATEVLRFKVTLRDSDPEICRQVEVVSTSTLAQLHRVLQVAMGWTDSHLHQYRQGDRCFCMADPELELEGEDERKVRLDALLRQPGDQLVYEYDFGDGWEHDVVLEGIGPVTGDEPRVSGGRGACPPEDVGGMAGFELFLEVLANPKHPQHGEMMEWHGPFDPDAFDIAATNRALRGRGRRRSGLTS